MASTLTVDNIVGATLSNEISISGHIIYTDTAVLAGQGVGATSTNTTYTETGCTITVPSAKVAKLSKIIIIASGSVRVNKDTHAFADWKLERSAPSVSQIAKSQIGVVAGGSEVYDQVALHGVDSSLGTGDHTYKVYFRDAEGSGGYAGTIYYNHQGWQITVLGVA